MARTEGYSGDRMQRSCVYESSIVVDTAGNIANCTAIDLRHYAGGSVSVAAGSALTTLTLYACHTVDGTYLAAYDNLNVAITLTVAESRCVQLPDAIFAYPFIKLVGNATGSVTLFAKT